MQPLPKGKDARARKGRVAKASQQGCAQPKPKLVHKP